MAVTDRDCLGEKMRGKYLLQGSVERGLRETRDRHVADRGVRWLLHAIADPHHRHFQPRRQALEDHR